MGCCWKILFLFQRQWNWERNIKCTFCPILFKAELALKPQFTKKCEGKYFHHHLLTLVKYSIPISEVSFLFYFLILSQLSKMPLLKSHFFSDAVTQWTMVPAQAFLSLLSSSISISGVFCWGQDSTEILQTFVLIFVVVLSCISCHHPFFSPPF